MRPSVLQMANTRQRTLQTMQTVKVIGNGKNKAEGIGIGKNRSRALKMANMRPRVIEI